jgi:alpha-L-fucosidase 2
VGYTSNAWSWTSPGERLAWGIWFGGSAWISQDLWEHYAFTRDREYLRSVYPALKGAAQFWLANLVEAADGTLVPSPSSSPENAFTTDGGVTSTITEGTGIDRGLVWDLFDNTAQASAILGVDSDFAAKLRAARDRIRPPQIGKAGQLMEWNGDWDMNGREIHHRHISHLFPLFPGHQITVGGTPQLAAAAKKSLEIRGDDGTGWSLAWKINTWAHLHDGDHAHRLMDYQFRPTEDGSTNYVSAGGTYPNLFDAHPPFQIDGNFGFVSGVNEMLLQSQERYTELSDPTDRYYIDLLPALPAAWANGSVSGLRARGGFEVSMQWKSGQLQNARIVNVSGVREKGRLRYGGRMKELDLKPDEALQTGPEIR